MFMQESNRKNRKGKYSECERIGCNVIARYVTREGHEYCFGCRPPWAIQIEHRELHQHIIQNDVPDGKVFIRKEITIKH